MASPGFEKGGLTAEDGIKLPLKCLKCGGQLSASSDMLACPQCRAEWPVIRRIPRLFQSQDYYWGEIEREQAARLLVDARQGHWQTAVQACFKDRHMLDYCLDLQRASWLALLGLPSTAVALDIGCGYGTITHSLALSLAHVYAIDAISERIEFTQERLVQEGIANVTLLQASATALPFFENSFDLIVANGVLEWIGEWDLEGSPRVAQLRFLTALRQLLKQDGVLVIGIENRFSLGAIRGGLDHSGRAYTSLVPRWLATAMLRRAGKTGRYVLRAHNSTAEYRTYTYSAVGYRKILKEAGFEAASLYWAKPGYNHPHRLIPFEAVPLQADDFERWPERNGSAKPPFFTRSAKALLGPAYPWFANSYVIAAFKDAQRQTAIHAWFQEALSKATTGERGTLRRTVHLSYASHTHNCRDKIILYLWARDIGRIGAVAKVNLRKASAKMGNVEAEFNNLQRVRAKLLDRGESKLTVPRPIALLRDGNNTYALVSSARGTVFNRILSAEAHRGNLNTLRHHVTRLVRCGAELSEVLQTIDNVAGIDPEWYNLPEEVARDAALADRVRTLRYFSDARPGDRASWIQHGDFAMENTFFDKGTGRIEVIDWDDLASGLPPLYDVLTLIVQAGLSRFNRRVRVKRSWLEWRLSSFTDIFIDRTDLGALVRDLLLECCERLGVHPQLIPSLLIEFLLIRMHFNGARSEPDGRRASLDMLRAYVDSLTASEGAEIAWSAVSPQCPP